MLFRSLAVLLSGKRLSFFLSGFLVLFRHSLAVVNLFREALRQSEGNILSAVKIIFDQREWFGNSPYDEWGLWSVNVYANQRHLLFGISLILIVIFLMLPFVKKMMVALKRKKDIQSKLQFLFLSRDAWLPTKKDLLYPWQLLLLASLLVVVMPFFHGSALIALLLILFVMAIFSKARVLFLAVAGLAVLSASLQSTFFSGSPDRVLTFSLLPGFLAEELSVSGIISYLSRCFGFLVSFYLLFLLLVKGGFRRILLAAVAAPAIFAFLFQVSREMIANHKFIQIGIILFCAFLAGGISFLLSPFSKKTLQEKTDYDPEKEDPNSSLPISRRTLLIISRTLAVLFLIVLTLNGIVEWSVYKNMNEHPIAADASSEMTVWIEKNTTPKSVFLTAPFSYHTFFLSGRFCYYGHPYYAWSAGSDTDGRLINYQALLTGCDGDEEAFWALCEEENIDYILVDDSLRAGDFPVDEDFFQTHLSRMAEFPMQENSVIYKIPRRSIA